MKLPFHYIFDSNCDRNGIINSIEKRIELCNRRYFRYMRAIEAINNDISLIIGRGISYNAIKSNLKSLSSDNTIIVYDKKGLLFVHILRYIKKYYVIDNYSIYVISDYLYPKYISQTLIKGSSLSNNFHFIDTFYFINKKIVQNNRNKLRFLLELRDDFTREFINISSEIELLQYLLHSL